MPIYEYLCPACNRIYSFISQTVDVERQPTCPKCGATNLERQISRFSFVRSSSVRSSSRGEEPGPGPHGEGDDPLDDPRIEREMMRLLSEAEGMDENDPK